MKGGSAILLCGNMAIYLKMEKELSLREIQLAEYEILKKIVVYFNKYSINYILCGGTLLGAVRHNGFIPWDDDIDILVPRDDYEKLKKIYLESDPDIQGITLRLPGDDNSPHPFIKAIDTRYIAYEYKRDDKYRSYLWVDIFPMDHFSDDNYEHKKQVDKILLLRKILTSNTVSKEYLIERGYYKNIFRKIELLCSRIIYAFLGGNKKLSKTIDRTARKMNYKYSRSNHVGDGTWPSGMKDYFPMEAVEPVIKHKFEDGVFNIPKNFDLYLTLFYGDYMRIPPENERVDHHILVYRVKD